MLIESSGAGGRSRSRFPRNRPALRHPLRPVTTGEQTTSAVRASPGMWRGGMAVNVPGPAAKRKEGMAKG